MLDDFGNSIVAEPLTTGDGGYVQINNLLVEVKVSSDNQGYIVDIFNNDTEDLIESVTVWKDDLEEDDEEEYDSAVDQLGELNLDETEYDYYRQIIDDMYYDDKVSAKNGKSGYDSYEAVIKSARKTAKSR